MLFGIFIVSNGERPLRDVGDLSWGFFLGDLMGDFDLERHAGIM